jgi:C-terminal processing protease CtpA/Prc
MPTNSLHAPSAASRVVLLFLLIMSGFLVAGAQELDGNSKSRAKDMLKNVKKTIKAEYFDVTYKGFDLDAHFKKAEDKIDKATSMSQAFGIIAQSVVDFNDSHLRFYPPARDIDCEYGWRMQAIGEKIFVIAVKPGSDAEKQGLKPGDEIVAVEGFKPSRNELWKMDYYYNVVSPRNGLNLQVKSPGATEIKTLNVAAKITRTRALQRIDDVIRESERLSGGTTIHRFKQLGTVNIWKMPSFIIDPDNIDKIMSDRIGSSGHLILDLRGNGGGYVVALERLAGYFVEKDTKIADLKGRKPMKPQMAKTQGSKAFRGKLVVLIDSRSGSASEIFARFIQLENRGVVVGDQSAGAVMQSQREGLQLGTESVVFYGMSVTNADVIMSDGLSVEHKGVTPQNIIIKTGADLAAGRDPELSAALQLLGVNLSPEDAGKIFPFDWKTEE